MMKSHGLTAIVIATGLLAAGSAYAQQAPDLNAIPEDMPFNIPYGAPISAAKAQSLVQAAVAEAAKRKWAMNVAVVDPNGDLVAFERMDGAQLASISIAQHKARTAARYRRETIAFENALQKFSIYYILTLDDVIASRGGIPLVVDGKLIGAIGCSGGTGSQDEVTCKAALGALK
jgi:uncharacterized protein GlcG (DUF336 family)